MLGRLAAVGVAIGVGLVLTGTSASATVIPEDKPIAWSGYALCTWDDEGAVRVGGEVTMQEIGKHHVRAFRVKYKLYQEDAETTPGITPGPYLEKTIYSQKFPNDVLNYQWTGGEAWWQEGDGPQRMTTHQFHVYEPGVWRVEAKMTWDRKWRLDWTRTQTLGTVTVFEDQYGGLGCSGSPVSDYPQGGTFEPYNLVFRDTTR